MSFFDPNTLSAIAAIFSFLAAAITAYIAILALNVSQNASTGATVLSCLDRYVSLEKDREDAVKDKDAQSAEAYYQGLFDLQWSQFHLWQANLIPDDVMATWLSSRARAWRNEDKIECKSENAKTNTVAYRTEWTRLTNNGYFDRSDQFVQFMADVHLGKPFQELKRNWKRRIEDKGE